MAFDKMPLLKTLEIIYESDTSITKGDCPSIGAFTVLGLCPLDNVYSSV